MAEINKEEQLVLFNIDFDISAEIKNNHFRKRLALD